MKTWIIVICGLGLPAYAYVAYPLLLFFLAATVQIGRDLRYLWKRRERRTRWDQSPAVTMIIAAHNEEDVIEAKLRNCLELDYPSERLQILIGSDGSDDRTNEIVARYAERGIRLVALAERRGKLSVLNDVVRQATGDVLAFSDANTILDRAAVRHLVRHFRHARVGAVCGELKLQGSGGEAAYWRYEMLLKFLESKLDSTLGANGAIYAMRRELYPFPPTHLITDDFVIPMTCRARGYRIRYDPEAWAAEEAAPSEQHEFRRRVRIGAGNWQALWYCRRLLWPWIGFVSLSFWSHKVVRWVTPFLLIAAFVANAFLLGSRAGRIVFLAQAAGYGLALLGGLTRRWGMRLPLAGLAWYFVLLNAALACGFVHWLLGRQKVTWTRTARTPAGGTA